RSTFAAFVAHGFPERSLLLVSTALRIGSLQTRESLRAQVVVTPIEVGGHFSVEVAILLPRQQRRQHAPRARKSVSRHEQSQRLAAIGQDVAADLRVELA